MVVRVSHSKESLVVRVGEPADAAMLESLADVLEGLGRGSGPVIVDVSELSFTTPVSDFVDRLARIGAGTGRRCAAVGGDELLAASAGRTERTPLEVFASLDAAIAEVDGVPHPEAAR